MNQQIFRTEIRTHDFRVGNVVISSEFIPIRHRVTTAFKAIPNPKTQHIIQELPIILQVNRKPADVTQNILFYLKINLINNEKLLSIFIFNKLML